MLAAPSAPPTDTSFYSGALQTKDPSKVAGMFESIFYRTMLEQMRSEQEEDPIFGSHQMGQVQGMFDDELSTTMGHTGALGFKDLVNDFIAKSKTAISPDAFTTTGVMAPAGLLKQ